MRKKIASTVEFLHLCLLRSANKCLDKVAHMSAQLQNFEKAATIFEDVSYSQFISVLVFQCVCTDW